nr:MAG TPA: hypothetical protein [Caudoviricetes sp.]
MPFERAIQAILAIFIPIFVHIYFIYIIYVYM